MTPEGHEPTPGTTARRVAGWAAVVLHLATAVLYAPSGLLAPPLGVLVLWAVWGALLLAVLRLRPSRPWGALLVPVVSLAAWFGIMWLGDAVFGWTA